MRRALLIVDVQQDFCPGGSLGVAEGDLIPQVANELAPHFDLVVATQDAHPAHHASFAVNHPEAQIGDVIDLDGVAQVLWPAHCVKGTPGADFHPDLDHELIDAVVEKGTDPQVDSYSAFFDNRKGASTGLTDLLREHDIEQVTVVGIATDYCVKATVLDALDEGFSVTVVTDGCRGVELEEGDCDLAFVEMEKAGARLIESRDVLGRKG